MTQPTSKPDAAAKDPNDWYLETLVHIVTATRFSLEITLSVGGTLISGQLISGKEYLELTADQLASAFMSLGVSAEGAKDIKEGLSRPAQALYQDEKEAQSGGFGYIHLKNARIISGASTQPLGNACWRSRLSSVDGFVLGALTKSA
ncbi:gas vesicle accessory protein GvpU [Pyxidicoccus sp. 3LG]